MPLKDALLQALAELEEEYRFWLVESIALDRGIENLEEKIDQYEQEIGSARVAEFRVRLDRTRERYSQIDARLRYVRGQLHEMRSRLSARS
jgi:chromosome segregation ATPase